MSHVRRLVFTGALLAVAAFLSSTHVWGDPDKGGKKVVRGESPKDEAGALPDDFAKTKFTGLPVISYITAAKETLVGWQIQPKLDPTPARPRDILLILDTSASQSRGPLQSAKMITEDLLKNLGPDDRAAVWTANVEPKKLTRTFQTKGNHEDALKLLKAEYPSGASNLRKALTNAVEAFEMEADRQRVIVFLGDGVSVAGPIDADQMARLSGEMVNKEIAFYSVPLGADLDPVTLHGLPSTTGGAVVRMTRGDKGVEQLRKDLDTAFNVPVLYPQNVKFSDNLVEAFPSKLPPLRSDAPTLVVGKVNGGAKIGATVIGATSNREVRVDLAELVPTDEPDNFFLATMIAQWREQKDRPALMKADRALTYSFEQTQLAKVELLAQAEWALEKNETDMAIRLYEQTLDLDPHSADAVAGKHVAKQIKDGKITREQFRKLIEPRGDDKIVRVDTKVRKAKVNREKLLALAQPKEDEEKAPVDAPKKGEDLLNQVKQRQAVEDQRNGEAVRDAIAEAGRILRTNPDRAGELLKRVKAGVEDNPDISERQRRALADRLEGEIRNLRLRGEDIRRTLAEQARAEAIARERLGQQKEQREAEDRIKERMRAINQLMTKARIEIITGGEYHNRTVAFKAAEQFRRELIAEGRPVPPALHAAYGIAMADFHLTELKELRRQREQRFLLSFLEVERRHMPFPDEPPIEFPPAAKWRAITQQRKGKYESFRFLGQSSSKNLKILLDALNAPQPLFEEIPADPATKLTAILNAISNKYSRPGANPPFYLTFEINMRAFEEAGLNEEKMLDLAPVADKPLPKLTNITLASYIRRLLDRVTEKGPVPGGATFVIRKEADLPIIVNSYDERDLPPPPQYVVEITTGAFAAKHKETIAYSVADLVVPIPQSVNQNSLQQSLSLFGQQPGIGLQFGQQLGGFQFGQQLGGLQLGGLQLGGALQLGGLQLGGAIQLGGALQLGGLQLGGAQLGQLGVAAGVLGAGQVGVQGMVNLGVGGGAAG